ncbi:hypothetical protein RUND412_009710 [Rhizina undulata]
MAAVINIAFDSFLAEIHPFAAFKDIIPFQYLEPLHSDKVASQFHPCLFTQSDVGTEKHLFDWPNSDWLFRHIFIALLERVPELESGLYANIERMDDQFACELGSRDSRLNCLHYLVSLVGGTVDSRSSLDRTRYKLWFDSLGKKMKYTNGGRWYKDAPRNSCFASLFSRSTLERLGYQDTPVLSYTSTSESQTPRAFFETTLKIILGQFVANIKRLGLPADKLRDQEVFVVAMHGQFFHILRASFNAALITSVHLDHEPGRTYAFEVKASRDDNTLVKGEFLELIRGLLGLLEYLFSGKAMVGAMEVAFLESGNK